jgi:class 3 adenylate cyclase
MRVPRTFVFADLSGFTNYTADNGDDAAGRVLAEFRTITRAAASEHGVRIAKWLGDGCMVVAVEQSDAIEFVRDLAWQTTGTDMPLEVRAGMATGRALLFEGDDYVGGAVNIASRLCDYATGHEILTPVERLGDLPPGISTVPHGPVALRGLPEPIEVAELVGSVVRSADDVGDADPRPLPA